MKKKILLIDDDEDLLRSFQVILESHGFDIVTATDGSDCFQILENDKPDLLVLDVNMRTDFEGYYLLEAIKGRSEYRNFPIILLTGMRDQLGIDFFSVIKDEATLSNVRYQDKPVNSDFLVKIIHEMLLT